MRQMIYATLLFGCLFYALARGGWPERLGILNLVANSLLTVAVASPLAHRFAGVEADAVFVDLVALVGFVTLALMTNRNWALWTSALQLLVVVAHLARYLDPTMMPRGYGFIMAVWSYPQIVLIGFGVNDHRGRVMGQIGGSWRRSLLRWQAAAATRLRLASSTTSAGSGQR